MNHLSLCEVIDWRTRERTPLFLGRRRPLILTNRSTRKTQLLNGGLIDEKTDAISINRNVDNVPQKRSLYIYFRRSIKTVILGKNIYEYMRKINNVFGKRCIVEWMSCSCGVSSRNFSLSQRGGFEKFKVPFLCMYVNYCYRLMYDTIEKSLRCVYPGENFSFSVCGGFST